MPNFLYFLYLPLQVPNPAQKTFLLCLILKCSYWSRLLTYLVEYTPQIYYTSMLCVSSTVCMLISLPVLLIYLFPWWQSCFWYYSLLFSTCYSLLGLLDFVLVFLLFNLDSSVLICVIPLSHHSLVTCLFILFSSFLCFIHGLFSSFT